MPAAIDQNQSRLRTGALQSRGHVGCGANRLAVHLYDHITGLDSCFGRRTGWVNLADDEPLRAFAKAELRGKLGRERFYRNPQMRPARSAVRLVCEALRFAGFRSQFTKLRIDLAIVTFTAVSGEVLAMRLRKNSDRQ